jgi:WD40 repeat protein
MNTSDRFDRHLEDLLGDLAGQSMPAYIDEALATATARPQRGPSWRGRLVGGSLTSKPPMLRTAMIGLPVVLALTIGLVGALVTGGPDESPSPSPPSSLGTVVPDGTPEPAASGPGPTAPSPTGGALGPCPAYADGADARTLDDAPGAAWQTETGVPQPIESRREGRIAAFAGDLPGGRPAVVLIDPATGDTCRLIDLNRDDVVVDLQWTSRGDALAISTGNRVLVLSSAGLIELHRLPDDRAGGFTVAWSPTGDAIALGSGGDEPLRIVERTAGLTELPIVVVLELAWSPDGNRLHVGHGVHVGGTILHTLVTGLDQVDRIDIGSTIDKGESVAGWLDNDTLIVGSSGGRPYDQDAPGYDAYDVASGTRRPWASTEPFDDAIEIGYAPGLAALALFAGVDSQDPVDLVVRELPSAEDQVLERGIRAGNQVVGSGAWSPNGSRLAVSIQRGPGAARGLWLYAVDGSEPTHVSTLDAWLTNGAWQPVP